MKIGIFTGGTSVRSKNIFTDISRYPTGKHEIKKKDFIPMQYLCKYSFDVHLEIIFYIFLNFLKRELNILFLWNENIVVLDFRLVLVGKKKEKVVRFKVIQ